MSSNFATNTSKPTAKEYLEATEAQLIERMNINPGNLDSEFPFIKAVLDVKTATSIQDTNKSLVRHTRNLVIATWILCAATILASIASAYLVNKWQKTKDDKMPNHRLEATGDPLRGSPAPQP